MILLGVSAAFIGLVHSLAPGHWLPIVLTTKLRKWPTRTAMLGALVAASGHILLSAIIAVAGIEIGAHLLMQHETEIERYGGLGLVAFGMIYALFAAFRHSTCHGHEHHGPEAKNRNAPFLFLFSVGLSPCVAVLPVIVAAAPLGPGHVLFTLVGFSIGVIAALSGATFLVSRGFRLDYPILEHYGDVITGVCVALLGLILFLVPLEL